MPKQPTPQPPAPQPAPKPNPDLWSDPPEPKPQIAGDTADIGKKPPKK
ncbi:hypothetical protein [Rhodoplanes roseus]|nr:hypothetical protein [Rhodoplanes roseus]